MSSCIQRSDRALIGPLLLIALVLVQCNGRDKGGGGGVDEAPFAALADLKGLVEWRAGQGGSWKSAGEKQTLQIRDAVRTGKDSQVRIRFQDKRELLLEADSELELASVAGGFALLLGKGEMEVVAGSSSAFKLVFGDSDDFMVLQDGRARLTRSEDGVRIQMLMGRATVGDQTLAAGDTFKLTFGSAEIDERKAVPTTLADRRRSSRIRPPDERRFQRPRSAAIQVEPGTAIQTARRAGVSLLDDHGGRLELAAGTRAQFDGTFESPRGRDGKVVLEKGQVRIRLAASEAGMRGRQEVATQHAAIRAGFRGLNGMTDVQSTARQTRVVVHTGGAEVKVAEGRVIDVPSGHFLIVEAGGKVVGPKPLGAEIWAREGFRTRVFFDRRISRVGFRFKTPIPEQSPARLEIATSRQFDKPLISEPVTGSRFFYSLLQPRKYFWRIVRGGDEKEAPGLLELGRDPTLRGKGSGAITNVVRDTGIQTKVYFQGKAPSLSFKWDEVEGAADYQIRIYSEDDLEKAIVTRKVDRNQFTLGAGKLGEGTYYWYQAARDAAGKEIRSSQMNKLLLAFESTVPLLRIDSPPPRAKGGSVRLRGVAAKGSVLKVNARSIQLDPDGRFDSTMEFKRNSTLIFHVKKHGAGDVYFVRHLR
ncbi:MAG: hypothetical protein JXR96_08170 [Deltaproteobacteria bacterium]|nr:hypothetical protein [Deltaproteobacteria bacterium]